MTRSWAPRGSPVRRVCASREAWARATPRSYASTGTALENPLHELAAPLVTSFRRELHPDEELGGGNRRDRNVVVVGNDSVERATDPLCSDEDARIENQPFQSRSCGVSACRRARSSDAHAASAPCWRRIALTARPSAPEVGPMDATARPRRTTTNVSPRRSTASSSSEKRRAASVALRRCTRSDYQIWLERGGASRVVARPGLTYSYMGI